jgi:hypothetical protein
MWVLSLPANQQYEHSSGTTGQLQRTMHKQTYRIDALSNELEVSIKVSFESICLHLSQVEFYHFVREMTFEALHFPQHVVIVTARK